MVIKALLEKCSLVSLSCGSGKDRKEPDSKKNARYKSQNIISTFRFSCFFQLTLFVLCRVCFCMLHV